VRLACLNWDDSDPALEPSTNNDTRLQIPIESLNIVAYRGITRWLAADRHPFDFAHLRELHIRWNGIPLPPPAFAAAALSLELLDIDADLATGVVDLAAYPRLTSIHIQCESREYLWMVLDTLGTIPRANRVREIIVYNTPIGEAGRKRIAQRLAAMRMPNLKTLEVRRASYVKDHALREWSRNPNF